MRFVECVALFAILRATGVFAVSGAPQALYLDHGSFLASVEDDKPASTLVKRVNWEEDDFFRFLYDLPQYEDQKHAEERGVADSSQVQNIGRASQQAATNRFNNALSARDKGPHAHDLAASSARDGRLASEHASIVPLDRLATQAHALRSRHPYESTDFLRKSPATSILGTDTALFPSDHSELPQGQPPSFDKTHFQNVHERPSSSVSNEQSFWDSEFSSFTSHSTPSSSHRSPPEASSNRKHISSQGPLSSSPLPSHVRLPPLLRASENRAEASSIHPQALAIFEAPYILNSMDVADGKFEVYTPQQHVNTRRDPVSSSPAHEYTSTITSSKRSKIDSKVLHHPQGHDQDLLKKAGSHAAVADDNALPMQFSNLFMEDETDQRKKAKKRRRASSPAEEAAMELEAKRKKSSSKSSMARDNGSKRSIKVVLPQNPSYPENVTKRWQLIAALIYYKHEKAFRETNNIQSWLLSFDEFQQLSERGRQLYWSIKKARMPSERQMEARFARREKRVAVREVTRGEIGTSRRQQRRKADRNQVEKDAALCQKLRHKISQIKLGRHYGSSWSIKDNEDLQELGEKELWKREMRTLRIALGKIRTIIEHTWSIDPRKLSKLDLNPMGKDPIAYIEELLPQAPE